MQTRHVSFVLVNLLFALPLVAAPVGAIDLTGGKLAKFLDKTGTNRDLAIGKFVRDPNIALPLPDPTTLPSEVQFRSNTVSPGAIPLIQANWQVAGSGYKYKDRSGAAGGVQKILLKPGGNGGKIIVKAKGDGYGVKPLFGPVGYVEIALTVGGTTYCGRFESPPSDIRKNEAAKIVIKGPSIACTELVPTPTPTATATPTSTPFGPQACCSNLPGDGGTYCTSSLTYLECTSAGGFPSALGNQCDAVTGGCVTAPASTGTCCEPVGSLVCGAGPGMTASFCSSGGGTVVPGSTCLAAGCGVP